MPQEPYVQPLSASRRTRFFFVLLGVFLVVMPIFVLYAIGFRFDFKEAGTLKSVGGLYVSSRAANIELSVDGEPVTDMRVFRQAAYVQNLSAGLHEVVVARDDLTTWVKTLPVYPHIVTEVEAFTLPRIPHIRYIAEFVTPLGTPILESKSATATPSTIATTTTDYIVATTTPPSAERFLNSEYEYVKSLFADVRATTTDVARATSQFGFVVESATTSATSTRVFAGVTLSFGEDENVYATWTGSGERPYYYCARYESATTTVAHYGQHVYDALKREGKLQDATRGEWVCRDKIAIDDRNESVLWFAFLPNSNAHVLMHLSSGLYVVEVDDRAWQNVQLLYPGSDIDVVTDDDSIYITDGGRYFEVVTKIAP